MKDPRKIRQTIQAIVSVALIVIPWVLPVIEAYPKLKALSSALGVLLALLTNPRLVAVLNAVMPDAGSSAVLPVTTLEPNPAAPLAKTEPTPVTVPLVRKKDAGRFETLTWAIVVVALIGTLLCLWLIVRPGVARADTPSPQPDLPGTLGCFDTARNYCGRLVMPAGVGGISLLTKKVSYGAFTGGVGLGVDLWAQKWHTITPAVALVAKAESDANFVNVAGLLGVAKVAWIGGMVHVDAALTEWSLLAGLDPIVLVQMVKGKTAQEPAKAGQ
jgi:hypothetical protein